MHKFVKTIDGLFCLLKKEYDPIKEDYAPIPFPRSLLNIPLNVLNSVSPS